MELSPPHHEEHSRKIAASYSRGRWLYSLRPQTRACSRWCEYTECAVLHYSVVSYEAIRGVSGTSLKQGASVMRYSLTAGSGGSSVISLHAFHFQLSELNNNLVENAIIRYPQALAEVSVSAMKYYNRACLRPSKFRVSGHHLLRRQSVRRGEESVL